MKYILGPEHDKRELNLFLPVYDSAANPSMLDLSFKLKKLKHNYRIGVLVSGGLDSAILYYLLLKTNLETGGKFTITPYTILRKEGSKHYAEKLINYVNSLCELPSIDLNVVGDNTLPEIHQVHSGQKEVLQYNDFVYIGIIEARPEHSVDWVRYDFKEKLKVRYPFIHLQKSHIVDLILQNNLQEIFNLTHSCAVNELTPCGQCNGCRERQWGFDQMNITNYK